MVTVKRFHVMSVGIISTILSAVMGLLFGLWVAFISVIWLSLDPFIVEDLGPLGWIFGGFAIVIAPICYGVCGFILGILYAALYNLFAKWVGGIKVELEPPTKSG